MKKDKKEKEFWGLQVNYRNRRRELEKKNDIKGWDRTIVNLTKEKKWKKLIKVIITQIMTMGLKMMPILMNLRTLGMNWIAKKERQNEWGWKQTKNDEKKIKKLKKDQESSKNL